MRKQNLVYLHLGTNLGDRTANLTTVCQHIEKEIAVIHSKSAIYETEAWGKEDQPSFLNQAISLSCDLAPIVLLDKCQHIENLMGRQRLEKWGPRTIDVDILFIGSAIIDEERLKVPHPMLEKRNFVLIPLMEIAADLLHPINEKTIETLYTESSDTGEVILLN